MEIAWTSTPSYGFRPFVRNLLIKLDKICQPTRGMASTQGGYRASHTMMRHRHVASSGEFGSVFVSLWLVVIPPCMVLGVLRAGGRRTRGVACVTPCRTECCWSKSFLSACIDTSVVGGPQTHDDAQGCTPGRTAGHEGVRGGGLWRRAIAGVGLPNHQADRRERDGTAGREPAAVPDFRAAVRQDVRQLCGEVNYVARMTQMTILP